MVLLTPAGILSPAMKSRSRLALLALCGLTSASAQDILSDLFNPFVAVLMLPLQLLTSVLQALVFTLLVTVYIALATEPHEQHAEEPEAAPAH